MPLTCQQLIDQHPDAWRAATVHPFLQRCQAGTIQPGQFNTWLVQDYHFVIGFTRMAGRLLAAAPADHFNPLLSGIAALQDELNWFQAKAAERSLDLAVAIQPNCQAYCQLMTDLASQSYAVQATAFWAIELSYNQGWQKHSPMPEPYTEFADRWGNPAFTDYVKLLAQQADQALQGADAATTEQAEAIFLEVAQQEADFWQMAFEAK
ncbi:TenA family transcriptional regulator [Romeria aff. gracilis LEGE 07310]|uniref:Aminopyrimidine aminohydrolase n=1 Tax=Vasconcelosia minhoensis LEGE 07310 TaxID=915328 RepID=A0A8J7A9M6_9CYAN|nr:TenA family transcriptional regulator [Romeria gracilis]MBE9075734.1 TenA family transcriptional regulator [Romeria aff. gracilis LEGE 07310]